MTKASMIERSRRASLPPTSGAESEPEAKKSWLQRSRANLYGRMRQAQMVAGLTARSATRRTRATKKYVQSKAQAAGRGVRVCTRFALSPKGILILSSLIACGGYNNYQANQNNILHTTATASTTLSQYRQFPSWMHTDPVQVIGLPAQVDPDFSPGQLIIKQG